MKSCKKPYFLYVSDRCRTEPSIQSLTSCAAPHATSRARIRWSVRAETLAPRDHPPISSRPFAQPFIRTFPPSVRVQSYALTVQRARSQILSSLLRHARANPSYVHQLNAAGLHCPLAKLGRSPKFDIQDASRSTHLQGLVAPALVRAICTLQGSCNVYWKVGTTRGLPTAGAVYSRPSLSVAASGCYLHALL